MESVIERLCDAQASCKPIGAAPAFVDAITSLATLAGSEASVLITGETGTGKELVAHAIHYLSTRARFPFVPVNCGSLQETLLEDELFGHERGAFTDAHTQRQGLFAQAEKGTLFLDEVDALSARAQMSLLRVLQDKSYRLVGSSREQKADVRVVAATNARLGQLVHAGSFRSDLYYRLGVLLIDLPPLRERREDILMLAHHFLKKHAPTNKPELQLAPSAGEVLVSYEWPGNVRELENTIIRGIQLSQTNFIEIHNLGIPTLPQNGHPILPSISSDCHSLKYRKREVIGSFEHDYLVGLMQVHRGNVSRASSAAGKDRRNFSKLLKKHKVDPKLFRPHSQFNGEKSS